MEELKQYENQFVAINDWDWKPLFSKGVGDENNGLVVFSDYTNMSISTGSVITLGTGVLLEGKRINNLSGITFQIGDNDIVRIISSDVRNNVLYTKMRGLKPGTSSVTINDSNTGFCTTIQIVVYDNHSYSFSLSNVPTLHIEQYPTNVYNVNGLYIDHYSYTVNEDQSATVVFDVYNTNYTYGVVEVCDENGYVKSGVLINKMTSSNTSIKKAVWDNIGFIIRDIRDGDLLTYRQESGFSKKTTVTVKIPKNGYIRICSNPHDSTILGVVNSADILMSLASIAKEIKNYDVNSEPFSKELTLKLITDKAKAAYLKDGNKFKEKLTKNVTKKVFITSKSMEDFSSTIINNMSELELGGIIMDTAKSFGLDFGEKTLMYFFGPAGTALQVMFGIGKAENVILQMMDYNQDVDDSVISIHNQGGGVRSSQQIKVESTNGFSSDVSLNVYTATIDPESIALLKEFDTKLYEAITEGTTYTYNISLLKNGHETQPDGTVTVYIPIPDDLKFLAYLGKVKIYRLEKDGTMSEMDVSISGDCLVFTTDHFSLYTIVGYDPSVENTDTKIFQLERDYLTLPIGSSTQLSVNTASDALLDMIQWTAEGAAGSGTPQDIIQVEADGTITAQNAGTAYVVASVTIDGVTYSDRCRVDVTVQESPVAVQGVQLGKKALTTELFKTDYASFDVLLLLKQNETQDMATNTIDPEDLAPEDQGIAITSARFEDETMDGLFRLAVKDDRTLLVVPRKSAVDNPKSVAKSYSGRVIVNVEGREFTTDGKLTLTVKKTMPKLKAATLTFNSFYPGEEKTITITGGTVTGILRNSAKDTGKTTALPKWLTLSEGVLTLTGDAPEKSASGRVYVLAETEEWAIPIAVTVPVKLVYKAPGLKLSASSITLAKSGSVGVSLKLLCTGKADTLNSLAVSGIQAPEGFEARDFDPADGSFTLVPMGELVPGNKQLVVSFGDTAKTVKLKLKVSAKAVTLSAKPTTVTLNAGLGDSAVIPLTVSPADYRITAPTFRLTDSSGAATNRLDYTYSGGAVSIRSNTDTEPGATYKLYIRVPDSKEIAVTVKTFAEKNSTPTLSAKVTGSIDLSFPESYAAVAPRFRSYNSGKCTLESWKITASKGKTEPWDATDDFTLEVSGSEYRVLAKGNLTPENTYTLSMTFSLSDGSTYSCTARIPVKRTAVKLKLSKTSLSLNNSVMDSAMVDVTCLKKNYDLREPVISGPENLNVMYSDGQLLVAVNAKTEYGATYRVSIRATQYDAPVTLTVKIPAEKKSAVTATLKATGQLDVIRDSTAITVTPTYKNCLREPNAYWQMDIYSSADGYAEPVNSLFHVEKTDRGSFVITRAVGSQINPKLKYRAVLTSKFVNVTVKSAPIALKVTAGSAKITAQAPGSTLYAVDKNSRADFRLIPGDSELNKILSVRLKNQSDRNLFELFDYGNGAYAIGFKNGEVDQSLMFGKTAISLPLEVILDGNGTPGASIAVPLKFQYAPYAKTRKINLFAGVRDITGGTLEMDTEGAYLLTVKSEPANAPRQYVWSSSNNAVATVDPNTYVVYPHGAGEAELTCTAADGSNISAKFKIKVTQAVITDLSICQTYCTGTELNAETLKLTATLKDGFNKRIYEGFTCSPSVLNEVGTQTVTISYGGFSKSIDVEVIEFTDCFLGFSDAPSYKHGSVNWMLVVKVGYIGNCPGVYGINETMDIDSGPVGDLWEGAKSGVAMAMKGDLFEDNGVTTYTVPATYILPDKPTFGGEHSITVTVGDVSKTACFTLVYSGNYTSGTGWSVTNVSWK